MRRAPSLQVIKLDEMLVIVLAADPEARVRFLAMLADFGYGDYTCFVSHEAESFVEDIQK